MSKRTIYFLLLFFAVLMLIGTIALDHGILLTSILVTFPYVIISQVIIITFFKYRISPFWISLLITMVCLSSYFVLKKLMTIYGFCKY